jgi:putative chitinase
MSLNYEKLRGLVPDKVIKELPEISEKFKINTILRLAHFLSQTSHESRRFTVTEEDLRYSAKRLKEIFPKYFPGNLAESYAQKPIKIASKVYGGRLGNGPEETTEGFIFRGRGYIQCTGKDNYKKLSEDFGVDFIKNPNLVATDYPLASAGWYFFKNNLNVIADKGSSDEVIKEITKKINGGTIGLAERITEFKRYYSILTK